MRQVGLGVAGLSLTQLKSFGLPATQLLSPRPAVDNVIRLSSNENPYGPSPLAREAMTDSILNSNRYNWNITGDLIAAIAIKNNVTDDNILIAAGSTEILDTLVHHFAMQQGSFVVAAPSYTNWSKAGEKAGLKKITVPLTADKKHNLQAMLAAITAHTKFIYVCNPNNPT